MDHDPRTVTRGRCDRSGGAARRHMPATAGWQFPAPAICGSLIATQAEGQLRMTHDEALARSAGLGAPWQDRGAEVAEAVAHASRLAAAFARPADERAEPMPAYAVPAPRTAR